MPVKKFNIEMPIDSRGQRTTAVPTDQAISSEWVTPVHLMNAEDTVKELYAQNPFSGSSDTQVTFSTSMGSLIIASDAVPGEANLTFNVNDFNFILQPGEVFDERLFPFTEVTISSTVPFRGYVRGETLATATVTTLSASEETDSLNL